MRDNRDPHEITTGWLVAWGIANVRRGRLPRLTLVLDWGDPGCLLDAPYSDGLGDPQILRDFARAIEAGKPQTVDVLAGFVSAPRGLMKLGSRLLPSHYLEVTEITGAGSRDCTRYIVPLNVSRAGVKRRPISDLFVWERLPPGDRMRGLPGAFLHLPEGPRLDPPDDPDFQSLLQEFQGQGYSVLRVPENYYDDPTVNFPAWSF